MSRDCPRDQRVGLGSSGSSKVEGNQREIGRFKNSETLENRSMNEKFKIVENRGIPKIKKMKQSSVGLENSLNVENSKLQKLQNIEELTRN